ncbi:PPE family protein [Mycobacterium pseudoshottsii JCM 15466]|nr:PPE family protein [Mycobacterium pseudoshottsii JCM 15466]
MASPPEVHSSLPSTGPGPGGILVAAAGWLSLGALFEATAAEVDHQICEAIRLWQGRAADDYVAAHTPYVVWLDHAAIVCQRAGAALQMMVAAYGDALAEMPTMAELQENHAVHGVLVATNFFGLNGVPIAVNEADYVRMWIQAAGVMGVYESCTSAALLEVPPTCPSPVLVNPGVEGVGNATSWSGFADSDEFSVSSFNDGVLGLDVAGELCEFDPFDGLDLDGCQLVSVSTTQGFGAAMDVTAAPGSPLSGAALAPTGHICAGVPLATSTPLGVTRHVGDLQMMAARDNSDRAVVDAPHEILVSDSRGGTAQSGRQVRCVPEWDRPPWCRQRPMGGRCRSWQAAVVQERWASRGSPPPAPRCGPRVCRRPVVVNSAVVPACPSCRLPGRCRLSAPLAVAGSRRRPCESTPPTTTDDPERNSWQPFPPASAGAMASRSWPPTGIRCASGYAAVLGHYQI